jgi:hypothetical protein
MRQENTIKMDVFKDKNPEATELSLKWTEAKRGCPLKINQMLRSVMGPTSRGQS